MSFEPDDEKRIATLEQKVADLERIVSAIQSQIAETIIAKPSAGMAAVNTSQGSTDPK